MKTFISIFVFTLFILTFIDCHSQNEKQEINDFPVLKGPYLGQKPPEKIAVKFAPDVINYEPHESPVFFDNGVGILIGTMMEGTKYYQKVNQGWTLTNNIPISLPKNCQGLSVSPSGERIYFLIWENDDENFYFIEKKDNGWTSPKTLGNDVNAFKTHWQFSIAKNENLYFSSDGMRVSVFDGNKHLKPVPLMLEDNKYLRGGTPYVAPDENYIIYSLDNDLHISYNLNNGKWTMPQSLGSDINISDNYDLCPKISPDGKYLFFISRRNSPDFAIYWVDAGFIEEFRPKELK